VPIPYDKFILSFFVWLFTFLGIGIVIVSLLFLKNRGKSEKMLFSDSGRSYNRKKTVLPAYHAKEKSDIFREKLGKKVVQYMIEVATSNNLALVRDRVKKIRDECERLNSMDLPRDSKQIISSVLFWSRKIDVYRHVNEIRIFRKSSQIVYDPRKHDFKLRIQGE
jgi:hypothetical protein